MSKKSSVKKNKSKQAKIVNKPELLTKKASSTPQPSSVELKAKSKEEKIKLAKLFGIDLTKPKQTDRIKFLFDQYQQHLNKSQAECFLYEKISSNAKLLSEVYAKQRAEIKKIEELNENRQFFATRLAYIINKYRVPTEHHKKEIKQAQELLEIYKRDHSGLPHVSLAAKEKMEEIEIVALEHYLKSFELNKELRNTIIGYENRLCVYRLNKLFLDYKLYVNQEILAYKEKQKLHNAKINREFDEVLSHFSLPRKKLANFKNFLTSKLLSTVEDLEKLKEPFKVLYDRDVEQIDRMVREMESRHSRDLNNMVEVIHHYQKIVFDKEARSNNNAKYLVALVEKLFTERLSQGYELARKYDTVEKKPRSLTESEIKLLLDLNRRELQNRIEKLKHQFTNMIKPLTDDFDKMTYLVDRDHALDKKALQEGLFELKTLENENINFFTKQFEQKRSEIEKTFDDNYHLAMDDCQYAKDQFELLFDKCKKDIQNICVKIIARNQRFWLKTKNEFVLEAKKFLTKLHYENAPWSHR